MDDTEMKRLIVSAGDSLPVPWEELWAVFQKILQQMQEEYYRQTTQSSGSDK